MWFNKGYEIFYWKPSVKQGEGFLLALEQIIKDRYGKITLRNFFRAELAIVEPTKNNQLTCADEHHVLKSQITTRQITASPAAKTGDKPYQCHKIVFKSLENDGSLLEISIQRVLSFTWLLLLVTIFPAFALCHFLLAIITVAITIDVVMEYLLAFHSNLSSLFGLSLPSLPLAEMIPVLIVLLCLNLTFYFLHRLLPFAIFFTGIKKDVISWLKEVDPYGRVVEQQGKLDNKAVEILPDCRMHFKRDRYYNAMTIIATVISAFWLSLVIDARNVTTHLDITDTIILLLAIISSSLYAMLIYLAFNYIDGEKIPGIKQKLREGSKWITIITAGLVVMFAFAALVTGNELVRETYTLDDFLRLYSIVFAIMLLVNVMISFYGTKKGKKLS